MNELGSDRALHDPEDDRLGYADFARAIATALKTANPRDGLVIAIHGQWGSGKSTALNFVEHLIRGYESPEIVRFNPWWFSGQEALTRNFLIQLAIALESRRILDSKLIESISDIADELTDSPSGLGQLLRALRRTRSRKLKDIGKLRSDIHTQLAKKKIPIVVLIDDVDRLTGDEIRQLLGVIKSVADFPFVTYLMAFDRQVVTAALANVQGLGEASSEYLDKIVQVPFELPLPDPVGLRHMLFDALNEILDLAPGHREFDRDRWRNLFWMGIDGLIQTPRDVVRFANSLSVTFQAVAGLVDPVDFIGIEAVRVFQPKVYELVRTSRDEFAGAVAGLGIFGGKDDPVKQLSIFHEAWTSRLNDGPRSKAIVGLLKALFPKMNAAFGGPSAHVHLEDQWRMNLRICSPDVFLVYFRFSASPHDVSGIELRSFLDEASSSNVAATRLIELAQSQRSGKAQVFIDRLVDYAGSTELTHEARRGLLLALFQVGDELGRLVRDPEGAVGFNIFDSMGRLMWSLLQRLDEVERYEIMRGGAEEGDALSFLVREVSHLKSLKTGPGEEVLTPEHVSQLEQIAVQRIRARATDGSLIDVPDLPYVLYRWTEWADATEARHWAAQAISDPDSVAKFLSAFLADITVDSMGAEGEGRRTVKHILDPKDLELFVEPASLVAPSQSLLERAEVDSRARLAAETFLRDYKVRSEGRDPRDERF